MPHSEPPADWAPALAVLRASLARMPAWAEAAVRATSGDLEYEVRTRGDWAFYRVRRADMADPDSFGRSVAGWADDLQARADGR